MNKHRILVLGATGKTGRRVVERLMKKNISVRSGSRSGTPRFDWDDRSTWAATLEGMNAVYITFYPDLAVPAAPGAIQAFTDLAVKSDAKRLVLLSGRGEPVAQACEEIVRNCGVEWTLLRASWFAQNFSESMFLEPVVLGSLALPVGTIGEPFVDADDIADVAVAALTEGGHAGQLYELTGPRLWTFAEAAAEIATASKRAVRFSQVSIDEYTAALERAQLPEEAVSMIRYLFEKVLDGRNESIKDGVRQALGREPRDFSDYVRETAATGVWDARLPSTSAAC